MAKRRQSSVFTVGALSCTTGIFLATLTGMILCLPYVTIADTAQLSGLGIFHAAMIMITRCAAASLPFGLTALCANYSSRNDWRTVRHLRLFTAIVMMASAAVLAIALTACAAPLSGFIFGAGAGDDILTASANAFRFAAAMILLIAVLYLYRGYYQGLNETVIDSRSQMIEQITSGLCAAAVLAWIWFHRDADHLLLYLIMGASVFGTALAIGYYVLFDSLKYPRVEALAKAQIQLPVKKKKAIGELFAFTVPSFSVVVLQGLFLLINAVFFLPACRMAGLDQKDTLDLYNMMMVHCAWLAEIPVLFAYRFSTGVIPDIAEGVERMQMTLLDGGIEKMFGRFLYVAVPFLFALMILSPQFFYVLYGIKDAEGGILLCWTSAEGMAVALAMISSWLMITLRFHTNSLFYTGVGLVIKALTFWFLIRYMGYAGAMASTVLGVFTILFLCLSRISNRFGISYQRLFLQLAKILAACLCMNGIWALAKFFGIDGLHADRMLAAVQLLAMIAASVPVYLFVTGMMKVRVQLFGRKKNSR